MYVEANVSAIYEKQIEDGNVVKQKFSGSLR
jgi:hypothetical protein